MKNIHEILGFPIIKKAHPHMTNPFAYCFVLREVESVFAEVLDKTQAEKV